MAQKTIDFENDILRPIGSLKEDIVDLKDNKITKFYTNNNGDTVLNDSDDGKIQDLMIYGKSEQKQYKGTNLLKVTAKTQTVNGIIFTVNEDGTVKVNGTATTDAEFITGYINSIEANKAYKFVGCPSGGSSSSYLLRVHDTTNWSVASDVGSGATKTYSGNWGLRVTVIIKSGTTVSNLLFKPMVTTDTSATYADFEPYTGGKPSPSPEYPQEIKAVVNPVIKTHGKNLIDITNASKSTNVFSSVTNGRINVKKVLPKWSSSYVGKFNYKEGDTVTIWVDALVYGRLGLSGVATKIPDNSPILTDNGNKTVDLIKGNVLKVTLKLKYSGVVYVWFCSDVNNSQAKEFSFCIQVEKNNTATDFRQYQETQATLPYNLYAIPVSSGGNVTIDGQQYIADYVDVERGKLVRMTELIEYDGTENWSLQSINNNGIANFQIIVTRYIGSIGMCDTLQLQKTTISNTNTEGFMINNNNSLFIRINTTRGISTLETFKEFLANKHIFILYALSMPTEIDLVKEEIAAFKALSTYYPKTYINAESEQLEAYTMFNYPVSMEKGWEYVKQQIGDTRKYVYDMDLQSAEAYVNSEYAVALTELEV